MDEAQEKFERTVGDAFVRWHNESIGSAFVFSHKPVEVPDLVYRDGEEILSLEITSAYYDRRDAQFWWQNLRKHPDAPGGWGGKDMDEALLADVSRRINDKCQKNYGENCFLIVYIHPSMTLKEEVDDLLHALEVPEKNFFAGVFLTGHFPMSTRSWGGYQCWRLQ
jgi:hypothetical protein